MSAEPTSGYVEDIWKVSHPVRQLLERHDRLRHVECIFIKRKVYSISHMLAMGTQDRAAMYQAVEHLFRVELDWNTGGLKNAFDLLFQDAARPPTHGRQRPDGARDRAQVPMALSSTQPIGCGGLLVGLDPAIEQLYSFVVGRKTRMAADQTGGAMVLLTGDDSQIANGLSKSLDAVRHLWKPASFNEVMYHEGQRGICRQVCGARSYGFTIG